MPITVLRDFTVIIMGVACIVADITYLFLRNGLNIPLLVAGAALLGVVLPLHWGDRNGRAK